MAGRKKNKGDIPRDKIIETALDLFAFKGFDGTSMRDVANSIGISISNIYHYFGNKEGLILAVLDKSTSELISKLRGVTELDMEPLDRFKQLIKTHIDQTVKYSTRSKIVSIINVGDEHLTSHGNKIAIEVQRRILNIYLKELRILKELGYLDFRSVTILAFNILGAMNWLIRWYRSDGTLSLEEVSQEILSFVLYGILGSKAVDAG